MNDRRDPDVRVQYISWYSTSRSLCSLSPWRCLTPVSSPNSLAARVSYSLTFFTSKTFGQTMKTNAIRITIPPPLYTHDRDPFASSPPSCTCANGWDNTDSRLGSSLGYTFTGSPTTSSSNRECRFSHGSFGGVLGLPSYEENSDLVPKYSEVDEPVTFAKFLFRFGFCRSLLFLLEPDDTYTFTIL